MSAGLIELEKNPAADQHAQIVESVFREAHSLKGAARAVNLKEIESICQALESVLSALKGKQLAVSQALFDLLYQTIDTIGGLLVPDTGTPEPRQAVLESLARQLDDALQGKVKQSAMAQRKPAAPLPQAPAETAAPVAMTVSSPASGLASETVRVSTQKLDAVMRQVEELLSPRLASAQRSKELHEVAASFTTWKKRRARMRPALRLLERSVNGGAKGNNPAGGSPKFPLQELPKLLEHLESEHLFMKTLEERLLRLSKFAAHDWRTLASMSDSLLHDVKEMHLLPFSLAARNYSAFHPRACPRPRQASRTGDPGR